MAKGTVKKLAIGTVIAGAAGYVAGILTAPKSGKETRHDIKEGVTQGITETERQLKGLHTQLGTHITEARDAANSASGKAKKELEKATDRAAVIKEKAREVLSAVHEGDAGDKDLQKAIGEASKAIDHLKSYLRK